MDSVVYPSRPTNIMKHTFPQYLSAPFQVLWFEADELGIVMIFFVLAMIFGGLFWVLQVIGPWYYSSIKKRSPRGFLRHILYFVGVLELKGYPTYFEKEFCE